MKKAICAKKADKLLHVLSINDIIQSNAIRGCGNPMRELNAVTKERLVSFTDAVFAIIITILVLDLEMPSEPTFAALWELRESFFAYAVSFFWLGAMWVNLHNQWHTATRITTRVIWHTIIMLFFVSLVPYVSRFAGTHFHDFFAQGLYWAVSTLASVNIMAQGYALGYANREDARYLASARTLNHWMWVDLAVKILGFLVALALNEPTVAMAVILVGAVIPSVVIRYLNRRFEG